MDEPAQHITTEFIGAQEMQPARAFGEGRQSTVAKALFEWIERSHEVSRQCGPQDEQQEDDEECRQRITEYLPNGGPR